MHLLAWKAVRGTEPADAIPQCPLLVLKALDVSFAGGQFQQEVSDQRRYRRIPLRGFDAGPAIRVIVYSNSDIFHILTLPFQLLGLFWRRAEDPEVEWPINKIEQTNVRSR